MGPVPPVGPVAPSCRIKAGVDQSADNISSVAFCENAVADTAYTGSVPAGISFSQLLPGVQAAVAKVYVMEAPGSSVGAVAARLYAVSVAVLKPSTPASPWLP